jgi:hypothetical protein
MFFWRDAERGLKKGVLIERSLSKFVFCDIYLLSKKEKA